ncbi:MAG: ATP cone domain-containing protein [Planctomycetota bacterium]
MIGRLAKVRKRDGRLVVFDERKIADAIHKSGCAVGSDDRFLAEELAGVVTLFLEKTYSGGVPGIEEIQDMVEKVLIETGHARMAKAYILYRERRARARERVVVEGRFLGGGMFGEVSSGPLVGNPGKAQVTSWSKARITDALVREADLDERIAADVAARVEEKVFAASVPRITTSAIRSLVEAELFLMDYGDRVGRQALVGLPRFDVDRLLHGGKDTPWRPAGPRDLKRAVADSLLAQYALAEIYSAEVGDAHMDGRIHVLDVGSPFEWVGAVLRLPPATQPDAWVESVTLHLGRVASLVTREVCLTGLTAGAAHWEDVGVGGKSTGPPALLAARRLLGHAALRMIDRRGGRLRTVFDFALLPPDPRERALADAIVREHWARFRAGEVDSLPTLVLHVPASEIASDELRRSLLTALAAGAETGRVILALDREDVPPLLTPWFRVRGLDTAPGVAQPVAGAVAINVAALAAGEGARDERALLERFDGALDLALKALRQKRNFLAELQAEPSMPLYRVAAGARPVIAGGAGLDLVHLCGVEDAAALLAGADGNKADGAEAARLAGRLRAYAGVRLSDEGRPMRLNAQLAPDRDSEAATRFRELGRAEPSTRERPRDGTEPFEARPPDLPDGLDCRYDPIHESVVIRFPRELSPSPETLLDLAATVATDSRVRALRLVPWPDRAIRGPGDTL